MVERLDYKLVGLGILVLLCWMTCCPQPCRSAVIWTDDFNDGTYEPEWTIVNNTNVYSGTFGWSGSNWSATNNYLQMLPSKHTWGIISRPSAVASGTWSFDIQFNLTEFDPTTLIVGFNFMSNDVNVLNNELEIDSFRLTCGSSISGDAITFRLYKHTGTTQTPIASSSPVPVPGWHHIDVTRTPEGIFTVYHNRNPTPIIQVEDTDTTTPETCWLWFQTWQMIDNIVVDDEVLILQDPTGILLVIGGVVVAVIVIVVVIVFLRRRRTAQ